VQPPVYLDFSSHLRPEDGYGSVAALTSAPADLTPIEQLLGPDAVPDAAFFVETWTLGLGAASRNFQRRAQAAAPAAPALASSTRSSLPSFSVVTVFSLMEPEPAALPDPLPASRDSEASPLAEGRAAAFQPLPASDDLIFTRPLDCASACRLLGIARTSTRDEIRAAYRHLASRVHPDRLASAGAGERHAATERMASLNEAYHLLCAARP